MQIEIGGLTKLYGEKRGLLPISFSVEKGEVVAVVGQNGAGKSTLLKILAKWILPDRGQATIDGVDLGNRREVVKKVGFVPEASNLFDALSIEYNLKLFAFLFQIPLPRVEEVLEEFDLCPFRKTEIQELPIGLKRRVDIGQALLADPEILLLDEPTSGLDFERTNELYNWLNVIHDAGKTIFFTSHRPEEIKNLATRFMVLHQGRLIFDGSPQSYFQSGGRRQFLEH